jgi:cellulose synthase/poly-beta-1,6-N-acetylglucosamine synthase-like glycosyltransferase
MTVLACLLAVLALLCLLLAAHPFITYPQSLALIRRLRPAPPAAAAAAAAAAPTTPTFGVFVCAYNEEAVIAQTLERLIALRAAAPSLEIMVHVDHSSDRTAEIARRYADQLTCLLVAGERRGKTEGMNLLVAQSRADILLFTDASVAIDPGAFAHFERHFRDPRVGAVCGKQVFTHTDGSASAGANAAYWRLEERIKALESEIGSIMTLDGSLYALRNGLRTAPPADIVDDFYIPFMIMRDGYRVIQSQEARSSEPSVTVDQEEFRRKIRIACQGFNAHRVVWPTIRAMDGLTRYMYVSHKLVRWFTIYLLAGCLLATYGALLAAGWYALAGLLTAAIVLTLVLGLGLRLKPFSTITNILAAFTGVGLGVWQSIKGHRYQVWEPPASARHISGNKGKS